MTLAKMVAAGSMAFVLVGSIPASADFRGEVESARAAGPVSEHDAELLQRWGCLSGTRNPVCERSGQGRRYYRERRGHRR